MSQPWVWSLRVAMLLTGLVPWLAWSLPEIMHQTTSLGLAPFCHQRPDRSLELAGSIMPVCSRCAGIFAGVAVGSLWMVPASLLARWREWLGGAVVLMCLEIGVQDLIRHAPTHPTRIFTGLVVGWLLAGGVVRLLVRSDTVT